MDLILICIWILAMGYRWKKKKLCYFISLKTSEFGNLFRSFPFLVDLWFCSDAKRCIDMRHKYVKHSQLCIRCVFTGFEDSRIMCTSTAVEVFCLAQNIQQYILVQLLELTSLFMLCFLFITGRWWRDDRPGCNCRPVGTNNTLQTKNK